MVEKKFSVNLENISSAQNFINLWCKENNVSQKINVKISVCSDEVLSNIVNYSQANFFIIKCNMDNNIISITFCDDGKCFDPLTQVEEPDVSLNAQEREVGGLGIFIVKKMMKSVEYNRAENQNILNMKIENI